MPSARNIEKIISFLLRAIRGRPAKGKLIDKFAQNQFSAKQIAQAAAKGAKDGKFTDKDLKFIMQTLATAKAQGTAGFTPLTKKSQLQRIASRISRGSPDRADANRIVGSFVPRQQVAPSSTPAAVRGGLRFTEARSRTAERLVGQRAVAQGATRREAVTAGRSKSIIAQSRVKKTKASELVGGLARVSKGLQDTLDVNQQRIAELTNQLKTSKTGKFLLAALAGVGGAALVSFGTANTAPDAAAAKALIAELILNQGRHPDRAQLVAAQTELTRTRTLVLLGKLLGQANTTAPAIPFT